jgi:hypothetical protein
MTAGAARSALAHDQCAEVNYFWPQNYNSHGTDSSLLLDDMVIAPERIGCTVRK